MRHVCMLGTSATAKGGISTVVRAFKSDIEIPGYEIRHVVTHDDLSAAGKLALALSAYTSFKHLLDAGKVDLVHVHSAFGASFTRSRFFISEAVRQGVPVVNHIHADDWSAFYERSSCGKRRLIKSVYGSCATIIALSNEWKNKLSEVAPECKISVLENFAPIYDKGHQPSQNNRTVVFMSRLEQIKGCDILPGICRRVLDCIPDARFLICGDGTMRPWLERCMGDMGMRDSVEFLGWVDGEKKLGTLEQGSVFLLPSYGEGMPMCVLEAMGLGLPVVATRVGGVPQIVVDGETGLLAEPGDVAALATSVVRLLHDKGLYRTVSTGARSMAARHSLSAYQVKLKEIYDGLF